MSTDALILTIIDTDSYAGNFERDVTAFATGQLGECEVGADEARQAQEELPATVAAWWAEHALQVPDEHGCCRPVSIVPTPGFFNDGHGTHYVDTPDNEARATLSAQAAHIKGLEWRLADYQRIVPGQSGWTEANRADAIARVEAELVTARAGVTLTKYPAYQSVAVFSEEVPTAEVFAVFEERARAYLAGRGVKVLAVRLARETTVVQTLELPRPV